MQYGLERCFTKSCNELASDNPYSNINQVIDEIENGEFAKIQEMSTMYNDCKNMLLPNSTSDKLHLFDEQIVDEIIGCIRKLQDKRQSLCGLRGRKKIKDVAYYKNNAEKK